MSPLLVSSDRPFETHFAADRLCCTTPLNATISTKTRRAVPSTAKPETGQRQVRDNMRGRIFGESHLFPRTRGRRHDETG